MAAASEPMPLMDTARECGTSASSEPSVMTMLAPIAWAASITASQ